MARPRMGLPLTPSAPLRAGLHGPCYETVEARLECAGLPLPLWFGDLSIGDLPLVATGCQARLVGSYPSFGAASSSWRYALRLGERCSSVASEHLYDSIGGSARVKDDGGYQLLATCPLARVLDRGHERVELRIEREGNCGPDAVGRRVLEAVVGLDWGVGGFTAFGVVLAEERWLTRPLAAGGLEKSPGVLPADECVGDFGFSVALERFG